MSSPSLPLRFICLWRSRSKEKGKKKKTRKTPFVYLKKQEIQSETEERTTTEFEDSRKPKKTFKTLNKNLITIETIYQSLLTWKKLYTTWKTKQTPKVKLLSLETWKLEIEASGKKRKLIKFLKSKLRLLSIWNSQCLQKQKRSLSFEIRKKQDRRKKEKNMKFSSLESRSKL